MATRLRRGKSAVAVGFRDEERWDRLLDVFETHFAERSERKRQFVAYLVVNATGDTDSSGLSGRLQPRGYIDAIPQKVLTLHHNVTQVDPDSELDLAGGRQLIVAGAERSLDFGRTPHRLYRTAKFHEYGVPGGIENAAAMHSHEGL